MSWRDVVRDVLGLPRPFTLELEPAATFADAPPRPVDRVIMEAKMGSAGRVSRDVALQVTAVQRGRNEICSIASLPLGLFRGLDVVDSPLLRQLDLDVPNVVTMAQTVEDLLFDGIAWWQVTGQDFDGFPISIRRVDPGKVSLKPPAGRGDPSHLPSGAARPSGRTVWVDGVETPASLMIRFDSPNPAVLRACARAIRRAMLLDQLAEMFDENPNLREYFTDSDDPDVDPMDDDEIEAFLSEYQAKRRLRPVGWIPSTVKRADVNAPSPVDLQLAQRKQAVILELANGLGVDPEDLGVSTTSRTYQNGVDRKQDKINRVYAPYMRAITDRLSMGDVTRRGYAVRFDLTDYLRSDPAAQAAYWKALKDMGVTDADEIRGWAGLPGKAPGAAASPAPQPALEAGGRPPIRLGDITPRTFDAPGTLHFAAREFAAAAVEAPQVDTESRTITGLALPYGQIVTKFGIRVRFRPGCLEYADVSRVKHLQDHMTPVGSALELTDDPTGLTAKLSVLGGVEGSPTKLARDQLLFDAQHGLYDGLSVGVDFSLYPEDGDTEYVEADDCYDVVRASLREISSTPIPAFDDARVTSVAATRSGGQMDPCKFCQHRHAPGIACATFAAQLARTQPGQPTPEPPAPGTPGGDAITAALDAYFSRQLNDPAAAPAQINPTRQTVQVTEPDPYTFDRKGNLRAGSHDFSTDLHLGWESGDAAARDRVQELVRKAFAVTPANVTALNPQRNRSDLYVDQMEYDYPLWSAIDKGTLDDVTPFVVPKFATATGLVSDHTTGTEPTPGAFTATSQTITPTPVSGKMEITREAWDQGGNPQMSGLIWRQMTRGYFEALEAYAVAQLVAVAASMPDITIPTAAADATLDTALKGAIVPLHYIRGGKRFRTAFTQVDLYKRMVEAKDSAGRSLYPEIGPQNANGTVSEGYGEIRAHGIRWLPAWALAASGTAAASSYMFDPERVCGWASAPQQINLEWRVAWVDVGLWGYKAFAVTDFAGTREIVYDPTV